MNIADHPRAEGIQRGSTAPPRLVATSALHGGPKDPLQQIQGHHEGQYVCVLSSEGMGKNTCELPKFP